MDDAQEEWNEPTAGHVLRFELGGDSDEEGGSDAALEEGGPDDSDGEEESDGEEAAAAAVRAAGLSDALAHEAILGDLCGVETLLGAATAEALSRAMLQAAIFGHVDVVAALLARGAWGVEVKRTGPKSQELYAMDWEAAEPAKEAPGEASEVTSGQLRRTGSRSGRGGGRCPLELAMLAAALHGHAAVVGCLLGSGVTTEADYGTEDIAAVFVARPPGWFEETDQSEEMLEAATGFWYSRRYTLFGIVASLGHLQVVEQLLTKPFEVVPDAEDVAAAAYCGHVAVVDRLLAHCRATSLSSMSGTVDDLNMLEALLETPTEFAASALLIAAWRGHRAVVDSLLDWGADPLARDRCGSMAHHHAAAGGDVTILESLLAAGPAALEDLDGKGCTPLLVAAGCGHVRAVECLLAHGADPTAVSSAGNSLEACAVLAGSEEVVALLRDRRHLEEGALQKSTTGDDTGSC